MKLSRKAGTTSQTVYVFILDSSSSTGAGLTGLVYNSSGLVAYYVRTRGTATTITLATLAAANSSYSSGGFKEVDSSNMPGIYRLDIPNAALASGADSVVILLSGAANMAPVPLEIELTGWDNQDAVRGGMTALPNANAEASGGLITRGTGAGQMSVSSGQVILQSGTGTGQLDFTSGVVKANVTQFGGSNGTFSSGRPEVNTTHIAGSAVSTSSAQIGVNVVNFGGSAGTFSSGKPAVTLSSSDVTGNLAADVQTIKTQTVTCSAGVTVGAYVGNATAAIAVSAGGGVTLADGVTHGGTTAMMRLGSSSSTPAFYLTNSGGPAWKCEATAGNNQGAEFWGSGSGGGVWMLGGSNGNGLAVYSQGAASALLLFATGTGKDALLAGSGTIVNGVTGGSIGKVDVATWTGLIDGTYSGQQYLKAIGAATAGASSGGPGSPVFKTLDGLTNAISGTADSSGNRSGITYSL